MPDHDAPKRRAQDAAQDHAPDGPQGPDRRARKGASPTGFERRRGPGRRLSDFARAAEEGELTQEQFQFVAAIDAFKRANGKTYPQWTEILEVIRLMGYRKTLPREIDLTGHEDWTEKPDAPANVRTRESRADAA
jgi:hypothetical protein